MKTPTALLPALALAALLATPAAAQTLNIMRGGDAPTFDAHRTTW